MCKKRDNYFPPLSFFIPHFLNRMKPIKKSPLLTLQKGKLLDNSLTGLNSIKLVDIYKTQVIDKLTTSSTHPEGQNRNLDPTDPVKQTAGQKGGDCWPKGLPP